MNKIYFDSSQNEFFSTIIKFKYIDQNILAKSVLIRDINGQLGVVLNCQISKKQQKEISIALEKALGAYARPYGLVTDLTGLGAKELLVEAQNCPSVVLGSAKTHLIDRRVVGVDWLTNPSSIRPGKIPRYIFASIKGGVGRSTALCIAAAHLSKRGNRVLAIDFDLEAPGIGSMLLKENELPRFGSLDFLVESQVSGNCFDQSMLKDLIGNSYLGSLGARVDVIPAIGKLTIDSPHNALAKIARAYLDISQGDGKVITLGGKLRKLIELCEALDSYDFILVDSRAGLHESTAAAMLALGGELLLFGNDQPQTFQGYRLLFSHLSQFTIDHENDWRDRVTFVHAKSNRTEKKKTEAKDKFREVFNLVKESNNNSTPVPDETLDKDDIDFVWDDSKHDPVIETLECQVLHISDDTRYHDFNPILSEELLEISSYENIFTDLIQYFDDEIAVAVEGK